MHRLLLALVLLPSTAVAQISGPAQPMQLGGQPQAPTAEDCKVIKFSGDTMDCAGGTCVIAGSAELRCATTRLNADVVEVDYDDNNNFMGARASGNVLYVRGRHVMRCNALTVGQDHIQGRVDDAIFNVKLTPPDLAKPGVPPGRNLATFNGDIERTTEQDYKVHDGDFTLCDCGLEPPSWRFTAKEIDAHLGDRATLWWPVFRLRPFSLFELPIPMAPISMPLSRRAFGVLPPNPRFLGGRPLIDIPVFIPIGDSLDLTVIPGTRMDWAPPLKFDPSTWGAPRLGARVRYAPTDMWFGEFAVDFTHDAGNWRSKNLNAQPVKDLSDVSASAQLTERVSLNGFQRATVAPNLDWSANVSWISDDAVLRDFAANIRDAASNYLPSRTELLFRPDGFSATAIADYFVLTNNFIRTEDGDQATPAVYDFSNTKGQERNTMHRMPFLRLAMEPLPIVGGLTVDGDASFVRYGRLGAGNPAANEVVPGMNVGNLAAGVSYANRLGYFNVHARAGTDALFTASNGNDGTTGENHSVNSLLLSARVDTRLSRSYSKLTHTITPRIEYRSIPTQSGTLPTTQSVLATEPNTDVIYDARLQRRTFHQAMLAVDQAFWIKGPLSALPVLNLSLRQPFDLEKGQLLQTQAEIQWRAPQYLTGTARVSVAVGQEEPLREVSATTQLWLRYLTLGLGYARWQVNADRFVRSLYELAAPREETNTSLRPIHTLSGTASTTIRRVTLSYSTDYLMPLRRDQLPQQQVPTSPEDPYFGVPLEDLPRNRRTFVEHRGSIAYRSPCNCWGVSAMFAFPNNEFWWDNKRINILFDIGGYSLGNNR